MTNGKTYRGFRGTRQLREPRPGEVAAFLSRQGVSRLEPQANGELRFAPCPLCLNVKRSGRQRLTTSADINPKTGLWRCFACGAKGNYLTLTRAFGCELPPSERYQEQRPEDLWPLRDHFKTQRRRLVSGGHHPELLAYWAARGLSKETLDAYLATSCGPDTTRWPLHAWEKGAWHMVNAKLKKCLNRKEGENATWFEKAGGPTQLAIGMHLVSAAHGERVFLWEGEADAMSAYQLGLKNSISLPNGATGFQVEGVLRYVPENWPIFLGMDMDKAGELAIERFYTQVDPRRLIRLVLPEPYKDLNDWLVAFPTLTAEQVLATAVGLTIVRQQVKAKKAPMSFGEIQSVVANRSEPERSRIVAPLPWHGLNEIFKGGLLSKQTTGWLAPSGSGKTTAVNQVAIFAAASGCKVGLISLEDPREDLYANIHQATVSSLQVAEIASVADNLWVSQLEGSDLPWREILDEMEAMAKAGVRLIIVDNLDHIADRGNSQAGMEMKITSYAAMIDLAKSADLHVVAVWQCKKVDRGEVVNSGSQKGYGQTFLDAANYINMNRFVVNGREQTRLEVEKARAAGTSFNKCHVWLQYVESQRSFMQVEGNVVTLPGVGSNGIATF